ncbi:MAG: hypothetical protein WC889_18410 [Myxococcota bacterium]
MNQKLTADELVALVRNVFRPSATDTRIAIFCDLPDSNVPDNDAWLARRTMAALWAGFLHGKAGELGLATDLVVYRNVRMSNADLPAGAYIADPESLPSDAAAAEACCRAVSMDEVLKSHSIIIAPTEMSATAPLKLSARACRFRAATMPGFTQEMIPMLRLDYTEINSRVALLKRLVDRAVSAEISFEVDECDDYMLVLDLRNRTAHVSGGMFPDIGEAGNLPSGECYIVPYEGEIAGDPSRSAGELPVQFGDEVVVFTIDGNRAVDVDGEGPEAARQRKLIASEPAYANISELGFGVLYDLGIKPLGNILCDEKLGLHIAFGRSDHFGGMVGAKDFSCPEAVIHLDHVYIRETQPRVNVRMLLLKMPDHTVVPVIQDNRYVIEFRKGKKGAA